MEPMYAIFGFSKLKSLGNIQAVLDHMIRRKKVLNDCENKMDVLIIPPTLKEVEEELSLYRPRKGAVLGYDILLTASPQWFVGKTEAQIQEWEETSLQWAVDTFGGMDSIKGAICHRSEATPHLQIFAIPQHEGRLAASYYTGNRKLLRQLWTSYAEAMKPFGLQRGREYSPAAHKDIRSYYADVAAGKRMAEQKKVLPEDVPSPTLTDRLNPQKYVAEITNSVLHRMMDENGNLRSALSAERKKNKELTKMIAADRKVYAAIKENPDFVTQLRSELNLEKNRTREYVERFRDLVTGVKEFFNNNIPLDSELRAPEKLGSLALFWELHVCTKRTYEPEQILNVDTVKPPAELKQEPVTMTEEKLPAVRIPTKKKKKCRTVMQNVEEKPKGRSC